VRQRGLYGLFENAFDIVVARLMPKLPRVPATFFYERCGVDPPAAAMFEDVARNLAAPKGRKG
jgi:putative hydrolase of the HAD superfamily